MPSDKVLSMEEPDAPTEATKLQVEDTEDDGSVHASTLRRSDATSVNLPLKCRVYNKLFRSDQSKERVLRVLQLVVFFDFLGNSLMFSNSAYLFYPSNDPGLTQGDIDRKVGVFYQDAKDLGLGQAQAQNLGSTCSTLASAVAGAFSPVLARYIGKKYCFLLYTLGASVFYVVTFFSKDWGLLPYYLCRISTGLLAGSMTLANQYVYDIYPDPLEAQKKGSALMGLIAIALAVGPLVGGIVGQASLFYPFLVAAGLEVFAGLLVMKEVPSLPKKEPKKESPAEAAKDLQAKQDSARKVTYEKRNYKCWMMVLWSARLFDRFGGNQMSHVVTLAMRSYDGFFFANFVTVFLGYSVLLFIVPAMSIALTRRFGLAIMACITQTLGAIFTAFMGIAWLKSEEVGLYLLFFFLQALFNLNAMIVVTPTVVGLVPAEVKDYWLGYQGAVSNVLQGLVPLIMSLVLDEETCDFDKCGVLSSDGSIEQGTFLFLTAGFGFLSVVPYALLIAKFPKPKPPKTGKTPEEEAEDKEIEAFKLDGDANHMRWVSMRRRVETNRELREAGKPYIEVPWRSFEEDFPDLARYEAIAKQDMEYLLEQWETTIYEFENFPEKRQEISDSWRARIKHMATEQWSTEDYHQLGEWFGKYLSSAGWMRPSQFPRWWKAMLMAQFPRIMDVSLDASKQAGSEEWLERFAQNPVPVMRRMITLTTHIIRLDKEISQSAYEAGSRFTFNVLKPPNLI